MDVTLEKQDSTAKLKVSIAEEDYNPKVAEKVKEYSKKANLKGFRPGKVPPGLINKMYGKSIKAEEINRLVSSSVNDYIKDNDLKIVGEPLPSAEENGTIDWDNDKDFSFTFDLGLVPDFDLDVSDKVKVTKFNIKVDENVVNETIENLQNQFGEMKEVDSVEDNDHLEGTLFEKEGDFSNPKAFIALENVKESARNIFIGKKKGDKAEFDIEEIYDDAALKGQLLDLKKEEAEDKKGTYTLTISDIKRSEKHPLDQELFNKTFGPDQVKDEKEFREKLKETIKENYGKESEMLLDNHIHEYYTKNTDMDLPEEFLKNWLYESNEGKFTREQIEQEFDKFKKELKWNLIRNRVVENNDLKVENEEVVAQAKEQIMQQFGGQIQNFGDEMEETLNKIAENYLKQDDGKNYMQVYDQLMFIKALGHIKEHITIEEKDVSLEEFKKEAGVS